MEVYYIPYFLNYFSDMEKAYHNVARALNNKFTGFIIVSNNCIRKIEVPVAEFITELWVNIGFNVECIKNKEIAHIGTKNIYSKGRMARHTEHILKIWR